ncbi:flavodoxin domain-containing protein [Cryobacterium sp. SO2]|uniref:flavodoxin domain-containing protein n=1 Tax=Cryobacterium sp. SO2 TaxID=1897060 RepID=UPI00223D534C|nr:flavodoxin domain-containing protein [Cryobacterium sp. SO2]WEO75935.1 flavodoxin domain-containing protein [Cryobacterium sp. SO2]
MATIVHRNRKVDPVRVAVVCASHYGATRGIAERIGAELAVAGLDAQVFDAAEPPHAEAVAGFDAFVVGSAVYMGHWLKNATTFVRRYQPTLLEHPVWLFSSGPLGPDDAEADAESLVPAEIADFTKMVRPVEHRVFSGAIDPEALSLPHRMIRKFPGAAEKIPAGDFRDWPEIEAWAREIARTLVASPR